MTLEEYKNILITGTPSDRVTGHGPLPRPGTTGA